MTPFIPVSDVEPDEAFQLVFRELKNHEETGRKNFVVRVPMDLIEYLFSGVFQKPGMSKVVLESVLTEFGIYGFEHTDGRVLRRYLSGQTRMAWKTYQRILFCALAKEWVTDWVFRDLLLKSFLREAAQLSARKILNTLKRRTSFPDLTREQVIEYFNHAYLVKQQDREESAFDRIRENNDTREIARSLGFEITD